MSMFREVVDNVFTYKSLVHAFSGLCGGVSAITVFYPLNIIRTKLQVEKGKAASVLEVARSMVNEKGFASLYQGWWSSVVSLGASNFVYFYTYNALKSMYKIHRKKLGLDYDIGPVLNLAIASIAGVINVFMTTPLWVVGTRLMVQQGGPSRHGGHEAKKASAPTEAAPSSRMSMVAPALVESDVKAKEGSDGTETNEKEKDGKSFKANKENYKGIWDCIVRISKEESVSALWKGTLPSLVLVSNPSIQFLTYEQLRKPLSEWATRRGKPITSIEFFILGAIAKAVATVVTYPLQISQSRLRADREKEYKGSFDCLGKIYAKEGLAGWFKGMEAKLWQTVLTAAFQFLTYETIASFIFSLMLGEKPKAVAHASG